MYVSKHSCSTQLTIPKIDASDKEPTCLGQEDLLEKEMATHSSILPAESHGKRSLARYSP